jgi:hypothetical protein
MKIIHKKFLMIKQPREEDFTKNKFSSLEARTMLQLDYNTQKEISTLHYAKRWKWSERTVKTFLSNMFLELVPVSPDKLKGKSKLKVTKEGCRTKDLIPILINTDINPIYNQS